MYYTDDPLRDFMRWSDDQEEELRNRPVCVCCDEYIQEDYGYYINREWYCEKCIRDSKEYID